MSANLKKTLSLHSIPNVLFKPRGEAKFRVGCLLISLQNVNKFIAESITYNISRVIS